MVQPTKLSWKAKKHVLRYLRGTTQYGLWYRRTEGVKLQGFTDVDWAGSPSNRKSTSGGIFNLASVVVSWYSRKQRSVALSTVEAEYMEASQATLFHDRSKHIDIRYQHLRDRVVKRIMMLKYISTEEHDEDILTKALSEGKFEFHRDRFGVADNPFLIEREC
eukprot:PITA_23765